MKYIVIKEIPIGRFLCSFDIFPFIPVNTILYSNGQSIFFNGEPICDVGSMLEKNI